MPGLVRSALFVGISTLAGSWFGLGEPTLHECRAWLTRARTEVLAARAPAVNDRSDVAKELEADASHAGDRTATPAPEESAEAHLPQHDDPESVPSLRPWPALNPEASIARAWMVAEGPARVAGSGRRLVTLTFDDGPFLETTPKVLQLLRRHRVHATFFAVGQYLEAEDRRARATRRLLRRVVDEGHLVGNHTLDHSLLTAISHTKVLDQIDRSAAAIERAIGKYPYLFRPPYGALDDFGQQAARERHLDLQLWSVEAQDMTRDDSHQMFKELVNQLEYKQGGVVLLHDIRFTSVAVLAELLDWLKVHRYDPSRPARVGYDVVDLPTYLRAVEAAPLPYANRDELEKGRRDGPRPAKRKVAPKAAPDAVGQI